MVLYDDVYIQKKAIMAIIGAVGMDFVYGEGRRRCTTLQAALTFVKETQVTFISVNQLRRWWNHFLQFGDTPAERCRIKRNKYMPAYISLPLVGDGPPHTPEH
jgi:hypothetical protein